MAEKISDKKQGIILPEKVENKLKEYGLGLHIGDCFLTDRGDYIRIREITEEQIHYDHLVGEDEWDSYGSSTFKEWGRERNSYIKVSKTYKELEKETLKKLLTMDTKQKEPELSTSTDLVEQDTKKNLIRMQNQIEEKRKNVEIMKRVLENKRWELQCMVNSMEEKITKIRKVLCQIELYLGINEDIIHLQQGPKAPSKEPIHLRQQILYMDEEYGAVENQGLDFQNISEFDDWLLRNRHYESIAPEKKCVVVLRVRREPKDYKTNNPFKEALINQANYMTYVLIRNGDNIYRIYSDFIIHPRLFPLKDEIQKMYDDYQKNHGFDRDRIEEKMFTYQQNFLLLQGLIDRTPIFQPLPQQVFLFRPETYKGIINLIYDDEDALADGQKYYKDWHRKLNSKIKRGTRIYFCGFPYSYRSYDKYHSGNDRLQFPRLDDPDSGVYSIIRIENEKLDEDSQKDDEATLVCHYLPKEEATSGDWNFWDTHPRKNKAYFMLLRRDWFVLNYDLLSLDDIEYYINNRYERKNYLEILPILYKIKKERLQEIAWEKEFVKAMAQKLDCPEEKIWEAVEWWKHKVIWRRPIRKDDAKAWRMIKARIKRISI